MYLPSGTYYSMRNLWGQWGGGFGSCKITCKMRRKSRNESFRDSSQKTSYRFNRKVPSMSSSLFLCLFFLKCTVHGVFYMFYDFSQLLPCHPPSLSSSTVDSDRNSFPTLKFCLETRPSVPTKRLPSLPYLSLTDPWPSAVAHNSLVVHLTSILGPRYHPHRPLREGGGEWGWG